MANLLFLECFHVLGNKYIIHAKGSFVQGSNHPNYITAESIQGLQFLISVFLGCYGSTYKGLLVKEPGNDASYLSTFLFHL